LQHRRASFEAPLRSAPQDEDRWDSNARGRKKPPKKPEK
jgi:hypothetical protein